MNKGLVFDGKNFDVKTWNDGESYEFLRNNVDGYIEHLNVPVLDERNIDIWLNEEGKLIGLEPTIVLTNDGRMVDVVVGTVVFTRYDDEGATLSLTDGDVDYIKKALAKKVILSYKGDDGSHLVTLPRLEV